MPHPPRTDREALARPVRSIGHLQGSRAEQALLGQALRLKTMCGIGGPAITLERAQQLLLGREFPTEAENRCVQIILREMERVESYLTP